MRLFGSMQCEEEPIRQALLWRRARHILMIEHVEFFDGAIHIQIQWRMLIEGTCLRARFAQFEPYLLVNAQQALYPSDCCPSVIAVKFRAACMIATS